MKHKGNLWKEGRKEGNIECNNLQRKHANAFYVNSCVLFLFSNFSLQKKTPKSIFLFQWKHYMYNASNIRGKKRREGGIWNNLLPFICTFNVLVAVRTLLHVRWHSSAKSGLSIVFRFWTNLPSAVSSSSNIHLWHVLYTHPSLNHSERNSNHHLWSWPSWRGERW